MKTIVSLIVLSIGFAGRLVGDDVTAENWPDRITVISVDKLARTKTGDFTIAITTPEDPEIRAQGGSGGPMMKFTVTRKSDGKKIVFYEQNVCTVLLPVWKGFPQLEIWLRGGGGYWTRGLYRVIGDTYKAVRYDGFEEWPRHGNEKAATVEPPFRPHGEGDDAGMKLYLIESRKAEP